LNNLALLLVVFILGAALPAAANGDYQSSLKNYIGLVVHYSSTAEDCVRDTLQRLQQTQHSAEEEQAASRTIEICRMPVPDLVSLAESYEYGNDGVSQDKDIAIALYYFLYNAHEQFSALPRLKSLGANVATKPMTEEETKALKARMREKDALIEEGKKNLEDNQRYIKDHKEELKKLMDSSVKHSPSSPVPPP
jgi:hypothetical protein